MRTFLLTLIGLAGCAAAAPYNPPIPVPARSATSVNASFERTWNATIDAFAAVNLPIANMDRSSGFIAVQPLTLPDELAVKYADCGTTDDGWGQRVAVRADRVTYNVLVRTEKETTTVKVTSRFVDDTGATCYSRGVFETESESAIKERAEKS